MKKEVYKLPEYTTEAYTFRKKKTGKPERGELLKVAFQGEKGAYSERAIHSYFQNEVEAIAFQTFRRVFDAVLDGSVDYGVIPLENSLAGSIHRNYDLLLQYPDIKIVGEKTIRIIHSLIGLPNASIEDIERVYSHPQGLAQCERFLSSHPEWKQVPFYDTAGSVAFIAREGKKENAAIASSEAAGVYGMKVLKEGIEDISQNYTRFAVIALEGRFKIVSPNKASFVISTMDKPGALYLTLKALADRKLNMKKLESRPFPGKPWEYMFYIDIDVPSERDIFDKAVEEIKKSTDYFRILGFYRV